MPSRYRRPRTAMIGACLALCLAPGLELPVRAQTLTGALMGSVRDAQGGALAGVRVRVASAARIGGPEETVTDEEGRFRFPALPPGVYVLDAEAAGFTTVHQEGIEIAGGVTLERTLQMQIAGIEERVVVEAPGSRIDPRDPGFKTRSGPADLGRIPTRRASMFDAIRAAPGVSPTSPSSGTNTSISAFGSGTNENQFLFDGTNFTCPCNGVARAEPGVDFIQEVVVQSVGASAEFGNVQGAVINVVTRQGSNQVLFDASYYGQTAALTSQPVELPIPGSGGAQSGYERRRYRDFTSNLGGPVARDRVWFFVGYQHLQDHDSQPGTDPALPRTYEEDKVFVKLTSQLARNWRLVHSFHDQFWLSPPAPTRVTPFEVTAQSQGKVPAITFGHLTHTSANTVWDVRAGRFVYSLENPATTDDPTVASRFDRATGVTSGAAPSFGSLTIARTTVKATLTRYTPDVLRAGHEWKVGTQVERGEHHSTTVTPTGVRYVDNNRAPFQSISSDPAVSGGLFITGAAFASDTITAGARLTLNAGVRFDHARAISQDLPAIDLEGNETGGTIQGLGTLYTWNIVSPRLGATAKLTADGRTVVRASYGRFAQGVLTGELGPFHPGTTPVVTRDWVAADAGYTRVRTVVDRSNLVLDDHTRPPRTDEYSIGLDREIGRQVAGAIAFVHKRGANFIGWSDIAGVYRAETRILPDGSVFPVWALTSNPQDRRFLLTNQDDYSMRYNGVVFVMEKRESHGWQAFGSYTFSRVHGLQASSGTTASGAQASTLAPPGSGTFGRDPNDLTNAGGRLPNDRPHMLRLMASTAVPRTGMSVAGNLQYFNGKPWAATAQITLPQGDQRVLLEERGSRRLSSQTLLDLRISRPIRFGRGHRIELFLDVLNALNDTAEEAIATDNLFAASGFASPTVFIDPRRAMIGARLNMGR